MTMLPLLLLLAAKPNVVLIVCDDLGWADLGCYGSKYHKTPRLDRMAAQGLRFTDAYAACPVCSPSRAALLTGKSPPRTGITDWLPGRPDRPDQPLARPALVNQLKHETLAARLKAKGYATGHVGKWHLGAEPPTKHGFDQSVGGDAAGSPRAWFAPFKGIPGLGKATEGEYLTDRLTDEALRFIEASKGKPFFLHLAHYAPHIPLRAKPAILKEWPGKLELGRQSNPVYAAMLQSIDESVGRVLDKLKEAKLDNSTVVAFTSDNGGLATLEGPDTPATSNAPLREGKGFLYEGGLRVPLIVRHSGKIKPGTSSVPVIGTDLGAMLEKGWDAEAKPLFWHYPHYSNQGGKPGGAARDGSWKLVEHYEDGRRELFDLSKDAGEHRNLAAEKPEVAKALAAKLDAWRKAEGARMPTPNPKYLPNPQDRAGNIVLHARTARVHGTQLRYEPQPHKATLGYWSDAKDSATWEMTITKPGTFAVEVMQGCGKGQGGSEAEVEIAGTKLGWTVRDTGGWQAFVPVGVGKVAILRAGRHTLAVRAKSKKGAAVMDVRELRLKLAERGAER
ncbi:MAG: sulfatase-like hydrolase/transferase [Gemmataceae bacterium]|nr:sulfatase-like hydrolase/transferase [Gemmataceae bacterium]